MNTHDDRLIGRLYMRLLPIQIILVIISGVNNIIDSAFVGNLIGPEAMAVVGLFFPVLNLINSINDTQTIITCTGLDEFVNSRIVINKIFRVHDGTITTNSNE